MAEDQESESLFSKVLAPYALPFPSPLPLTHGRSSSPLALSVRRATALTLTRASIYYLKPPELNIARVSWEIGSRTFQIKCGRFWNSLPTSLRHLPSLAAFKRAVRKRLFDLDS